MNTFMIIFPAAIIYLVIGKALTYVADELGFLHNVEYRKTVILIVTFFWPIFLIVYPLLEKLYEFLFEWPAYYLHKFILEIYNRYEKDDPIDTIDED